MCVVKIQKTVVLTLGFLGILASLPRTEAGARFTHHPPSVLYVQTGQTARFVWDYTVDNRNTEFGLNSPEWGFYDSQNRKLLIGVEQGLKGWQWGIATNTCPARLLNPTIRVSKESTATLVISNVTTADNGVYGCTLVLLTAHSVVSKVQLIVAVLPQFNPQPPYTKSIAEGQDLSVPCTAVGPPTPNITWVLSNKTKITGTGSATLRIPNIRRDQNGTYECQAWNNPNERPVTAQTVVTVYYKPSIDVNFSPNYNSWNGKSIRLRCFAAGLPAPRISWYKPTNQQITTGVNIVPGGSEVTVLTTTDQGDYGQYKCRATNILGNDEHAINVTQLSPAGPVTMTITEVKASSMTLRWTKPADDGGSPVTGYLLEVSTKTPVTTVNTHAVVAGLKANTQYTVKVYPKNAVGYGQVFINLVTTKKAGKPPLPKLVAVLNHTSGLSVILRWTIQVHEVSKVMKYSIYKKNVFESDWTKVNDVIRSPLPLEYTISKNIEYGKNYQFTVTAWNSYGQSIIDETHAVTINIPINQDTGATGISPAVIGVLVTIAVLSLGLNLLQYLLLRNKMKLFRADNTEEKTKKMNKAQTSSNADQVYDNVIEMNKISSAAAEQSDDIIEPANHVIPGQAIEQEVQKSAFRQTPGALYESNNKGLAHQDNTRPVYEPLRRKIQHYDNESNAYQTLDLRNQNTSYQSLNASGNNSVI